MNRETDMSERSYNTGELVEQLFTNLHKLHNPEAMGSVESYINGYLYNAIQDIATGGVYELVAHVDWTNQRVEAKYKVF